MQLAVVNWLGLRGIPLIVLVMFFSMPILNLPPEFLPGASRYWLYSWVPLRFSSQGLRDIFYFSNSNLAGPAWTLGYIGLAGLVLVVVWSIVGNRLRVRNAG